MPHPKIIKLDLERIDKEYEKEILMAEQWAESEQTKLIEQKNANNDAKTLITGLCEFMVNKASVLADLRRMEVWLKQQLDNLENRIPVKDYDQIIDYLAEIQSLVTGLILLKSPINSPQTTLDEVIQNISSIYSSTQFEEIASQATLLTGIFPKMQSLFVGILDEDSSKYFSKEAVKSVTFLSRRELLIRDQLKTINAQRAPDATPSAIPTESLNEWKGLLESTLVKLQSLNAIANNVLDARQVCFKHFIEAEASSGKDKVAAKFSMLRQILNLHLNNPLQDKFISPQWVEMYLKQALALTYPYNFTLNEKGILLLTAPPISMDFFKALGVDSKTFFPEGPKGKFQPGPLTVEPKNFNIAHLKALYSDPRTINDAFYLVLRSIKPIDKNFSPYAKFQAYIELALECQNGQIGQHHKHRQTLKIAEAALALVDNCPELAIEYQRVFGPKSTLGQWIIGHKNFSAKERQEVVNNLTIKIDLRAVLYLFINSHPMPTDMHVASKYLTRSLLETYPGIFELKQGFLQGKKLSIIGQNKEEISNALGMKSKSSIIDPSQFDHRLLQQLYTETKNPLWLILICIIPINSNFNPQEKLNAYKELVSVFHNQDPKAAFEQLKIKLNVHKDANIIADSAFTLALRYPSIQAQVSTDFGKMLNLDQAGALMPLASEEKTAAPESKRESTQQGQTAELPKAVPTTETTAATSSSSPVAETKDERGLSSESSSSSSSSMGIHVESSSQTPIDASSPRRSPRMFDANRKNTDNPKPNTPESTFS